MPGSGLARAMVLGLAALIPGSPSLMAQAPELPASPRLSGTSFYVSRYTVGSSGSLYLAARVGSAMIVGGVLANPRTGYRGVVLGTGTKVRLGRGNTVTVIAAGAAATNGESIRFFALPKVSAGPVLVTATAALYQPVTGTAPRRAYLDPLTASVEIVRGLRAGLSALVVADQGRPLILGLGPSAQVRVPGGILSLELIPNTGPRRVEVRAALGGPL